MRLYVAVTDKDWFALHASKPEVEEVNFWRPSPDATFKALQPGELLLFKLHSPDNFIAGGGFFTRFLQLPVNLVWDTFGEANGVRSQSEMRERIAYYRRSPIAANENPTIGCIMVAEPFFWNREDWIPSPADFKLNTVTGVLLRQEPDEEEDEEEDDHKEEDGGDDDTTDDGWSE